MFSNLQLFRDLDAQKPDLVKLLQCLITEFDQVCEKWNIFVNFVEIEIILFLTGSVNTPLRVESKPETMDRECSFKYLFALSSLSTSIW